MGTTLISFLLSVLFFSSSHISRCRTAATHPAVPSSVTAKAAALQYWNLKFPNNKPLPSFFKSKLSTLSSHQLAAKLHTDHLDTAPQEGRGSLNNIRMVTSDVDASENYIGRYHTDTSGSTSSSFDDSGAVTSGYTNSNDDGAVTSGYVGGAITSGYDGGAVTGGYDGGAVTGGYDGDSVTSGYAKFDDSGAVTSGYANSSDISSKSDNNGATASYQIEISSDTSSKFNDNGATASYQTEIASDTSSKFDDNGATASYEPGTGNSTSSNFDDSGAVTSGYSSQTATIIRTSSNFEDINSAINGDDVGSSHDNNSTLLNRKRNSHRHNVPVGIFFRESDLKKGTVMHVQFGTVGKMPLDLHFLPRSIASEIPFSADAIKKIFHVSSANTTSMSTAVDSSIAICEMPPNFGEAKRCVTSAEDMMDFVHESLGSDNVRVRSTTNSNGSGRNVVIGDVKAVNGGEFTQILSCHQLSFPYLLHHCHIVPKTRMYEADMLEFGTKKKINHVTAICHVDTSTWGAGHAAFVLLGSAPGKIEVCHWIFPQDMAWTAGATY